MVAPFQHIGVYRMGYAAMSLADVEIGQARLILRSKS